MEMKVTAVQFLLVNRGMEKSNSAEQRKQLGGSLIWHLSCLFLWRGCEATAIERDSSVRAPGQRCCLLETFIRQRSQTRRPGAQRFCGCHCSISIYVYIVSASENHGSDHLLGTQYLHFKTHFFFLRDLGLTSRKIPLLQSAIRSFGVLKFQLLICKKSFIQQHSGRDSLKAWNKEPWSKQW